MRTATLVSAAAILIAIPPCVLAGPLEDGLAAYGRDDFATAMRLWRPLAEAGNASAQDAVGVLYDRGEGVPFDSAEAVRWWSKAAGQGDADAEFNLGNAYDGGFGAPHDEALAAMWLRRAADQGHPMAQFLLSGLYAKGGAMPRDDVQAFMWADLALARLAADPRLAYDARGLRDSIAADMSPSEIAEAQRRARAWAPKPQ